MSSDETRPNPGHVINRQRSEIPEYGRGDEYNNPDALQDISSLHDTAAAGGTSAHRDLPRNSNSSDAKKGGRKQRLNRRSGPKKQQSRSRSRSSSTDRSRRRARSTSSTGRSRRRVRA
ncbi:hypothetical protein VTN77DRAFT_4542 [Rasamsonia byssochlamydoides]|uniref:uncharacterized protein n=1 Tax=Rasamsonia byssochlamydoides TaxID=89139 RepID=UPI003743CC16